jgi:hypothetical protein
MPENTVRPAIDDSEYGYLATDGAFLTQAFGDTLEVLGLDRNDTKTQLTVAMHIIAFAKAGERDPVRLRNLTLEAMTEQREPPLAECHDGPA